jgi:hypothetical protein
MSGGKMRRTTLGPDFYGGAIIMDWAAIILAAAGGGIGGLAGSLLALPFAKNQASHAISMSFIVIGAIFGAYTAPSWLEPIAGDSVREITGQADLVDGLMAQLDDDAVFATIFRDYPGARDQTEQRLRAAYERGGRPELEREFRAIGEDFSATLMQRYLPRARNEDVLEFGRSTEVLIATLREKAPLICYAWMFDPQALDLRQFERTVGTFNRNRLETAIRALVVNAGPDDIDYDRTTTEQALGLIAQQTVAQYPQELSEILAGARPISSDSQKTMMCGFTHDVYKGVLAHTRAVDILRFMLTSGGGMTAGLSNGSPSIGFLGQMVNPTGPLGHITRPQ